MGYEVKCKKIFYDKSNDNFLGKIIIENGTIKKAHFYPEWGPSENRELILTDFSDETFKEIEDFITEVKKQRRKFPIPDKNLPF